MINNFQHAIILERLAHKAEAADPNDGFLISMCVKGSIDYLVTGDHQARLLKMKKIGNTRVLTPADFCAKVI